MIGLQLPLNKITLHFQLKPMPKVDQSYLRAHVVPPLQEPNSSIICKKHLVYHVYFQSLFK